MDIGTGDYAAGLVARGGPVIAVIVSILVVVAFDLPEKGVSIVGEIPSGLPPISIPLVDSALILSLLAPALLISIIGFVESVSVAQTLAAKRRQSISPDQELIGLGAANVASAISGGYPVTGGFARSVVNFDAGAETFAAGAFTAIGIALASLFLTPLLFYLPIATLAATIIVAVLSLVDLVALKRAWTYSRYDFAADARHDRGYPRLRRRGGHHTRRRRLDSAPALEEPRGRTSLLSARCRERSTSCNVSAPRGGDRPGRPLAAHRRKPELRQRPGNRGIHPRQGRRAFRCKARGPAVHRHKRDRWQRARKASS